MSDFLKSAMNYFNAGPSVGQDNEFVGQIVEISNVKLRIKRVIAEGEFPGFVQKKWGRIILPLDKRRRKKVIIVLRGSENRDLSRLCNTISAAAAVRFVGGRDGGEVLFLPCCFCWMLYLKRGGAGCARKNEDLFRF